jgi:MerR family redox-sensitive transcriptional activator SoxR
LPHSRTPNKDDWAALSKYWKEQLEQRIAYMEKIKDSLSGCIGCGCLSMKNCPLYNPDDVLGQESSGPVLLDKKRVDL